MKARFFSILLLVLVLTAGCGEVPTAPEPGQTAYPPPETVAANPSPSPLLYGTPGPTGQYVVDITQPIARFYCTPTATGDERLAVSALNLSDKIAFELQRAIYLSQQQDIPWRPAMITVDYDADLLTVTETIAIMEGYGVERIQASEYVPSIRGVSRLDLVPTLAEELGIVEIELAGLGTLYDYSCPTPGGPSPVPVDGP